MKHIAREGKTERRGKEVENQLPADLLPGGFRQLGCLIILRERIRIEYRPKSSAGSGTPCLPGVLNVRD